MTYKEFKEMAEAAGVTESCRIEIFDFHPDDEIEIYVDKESNRCQIQPK